MVYLREMVTSVENFSHLLKTNYNWYTRNNQLFSLKLLCILAIIKSFDTYKTYISSMPGTRASGRPGGNPDIKQYGFTTDRDEPLRERLQLRVPASMKQQLQQQDNWQELVRQAIAEKLQSA